MELVELSSHNVQDRWFSSLSDVKVKQNGFLLGDRQERFSQPSTDACLMAASISDGELLLLRVPAGDPLLLSDGPEVSVKLPADRNAAAISPTKQQRDGDLLDEEKAAGHIIILLFILSC
ncbi:hypothetical protein CRENBAI_008210 [Crenichthys baileyi]|uniref:Uncharacterized protein n=1 Tax=Crenichthys baileyi TaxID=28760 RepID=A0AAV9SLN3_9TELE